MDLKISQPTNNGIALIKKEYLKSFPKTAENEIQLQDISKKIISSEIQEANKLFISNVENGGIRLTEQKNSHEEDTCSKVEKESTDAVDSDGEKCEDFQPKKKKARGMNKKRPRQKRLQENEKLCMSVIEGFVCPYGSGCKYSHDEQTFLLNNPEQLPGPCSNFELSGHCSYGVTCMFRGGHRLATSTTEGPITDNAPSTTTTPLPITDTPPTTTTSLSITDTPSTTTTTPLSITDTPPTTTTTPLSITDTAPSSVVSTTTSIPFTPTHISTTPTTPLSTTSPSKHTSPFMPKSKVAKDLLIRLRKKEYSFKRSKEVLKANETDADKMKDSSKVECSGDGEGIKMRQKEKKMIDFRGKTYLAPLTTVGNLPFRRVCKDMGVEVTCGEMALSANLLQGQLSEWALLRRHPSEGIFGVQLCGTHAEHMCKAAQVISENACVDFIDINIGCPIDLVFKKGNGSAMMGRLNKLEHVVRTMNDVTDLPVTLKMRTGIQEEKNLAHVIIPRLSSLHLNLITMHGRSRQQRYTRQADWEYIRQCASLAKPTQFFGNGDVLSGEEYWERLEEFGVDGAMVARGALIKPWIFREIEERRCWDISATERLQLYKDFVRYGLEHWGSDKQGVENTRKFLLEWLSFTHRYVPVGLLEVLPQKINQKPPAYFARSPLETLLCSSNCADWLKITEMVLAPVPKDYSFLPKHKANSYQ